MIEVKEAIVANALPLTLILQAFLSVLVISFFVFVHFAVKKLSKDKGHFITRL